MAEAELNVDDLSTGELLATAAGIAGALENNAHFPAPNPPPAELDRLADELSKAEQSYNEHRQRTHAAKAERDEAAARLRHALAEEVAYVQEASAGDVGKILSAHLHVEETISLWPFSSLAQVEELAASAGDRPGTIDLAWDAVAGASGYEVESRRDALDEEWEQCGATEKSGITLERLAPGVRHSFRVRAVGERGAGDWSESVTKFAR